ncbi:OmpW family outer membrane protein [Aquabacterium sp. A3]|uniref:OmpW/AlkL family protein n=1 Tax=Aquabacterium sp. A3 TaxID=3132829 RepID=UPI0031198077
MKNINWSGAMRSLALVAAAACAVPSAVASDRLDGLFSKIEPSLRERAFMRLNYVHANVKTTSGDAYDVTGPVVGANDILNYLSSNATTPYTSMFNTGVGPVGARTDSGVTVPATFYNFASGALTGDFGFFQSPDNALALDAESQNCPQLLNGLGTPCGVKARSDASIGTPAISVGYFLDAQKAWVLEAFLLAAPLKASVYGEGRGSLNGKEIINLKLLPPTVMLGHYFGNEKSRIRPFVGLGASYAIFFDVRATPTLNSYQGGDTTVSIKNSFGVGPFFGVMGQLDEDWHISLNVGKLRYKTEATLITRETRITSESAVTSDYGPAIDIAIDSLNSLGSRPEFAGANPPDGYVPGQPVQPLTALMCDLAKAKYGNNNCSHGTFVRKQSTRLDNTLFMLSVGRRF